MKINELNQKPTEAGFYFVRETDKKYWQFIIRLSGNAPFLRESFCSTLFKTTDVINLNDINLVFSEKLELTDL